MTRESIKQLAFALVPFALLLLMMSLFLISVKNYIRCQGTVCLSISENIDRVVSPADQKEFEPSPGDDAEAKKSKEQKKREIYSARFSGRMTFVFLVNLYFFICLVAAGICIVIIYRTLKKDEFSARVGLSLIIGISLIVGIYLFNTLGTHMVIFNPLFKDKIESDLSQAQYLMVSANSFGFAVCAMLCLTICAILYSPLAKELSEALREATEKMKHLQTILYISTIMLILGMLIVRSVYQWSLAFASREEAAIKTAEHFFSNLISVQGGVSTVVLAVSYLPAVLIVSRQINNIDGLPQNEAEREEEFKRYHLNFSLTESLPKILAILGPILAGSIGDLFTKFIN